MQNKNKLGVTDYVSEIKLVENYFDFDPQGFIVKNPQGFIVKNIEVEWTEANDLRHIL